MTKTWYGNLNNRLEENKQFCDEITVGTGVTEYYYSDRKAYEVVEVIDQKHVYIRMYDHKAKGEAFSNDWELISNENNPKSLLTKRGNYWYFTRTVTREYLEEIEEDKEKLLYLALGGFDIETIKTKGKQTKYRKANVSFGVARYYYDYSF